MDAFTKVVHLGTVTDGNVYCKIVYALGKLSITGVVGPTRDGNARGGCGQIVMSFKESYPKCDPAPGWTKETIDQFMEIWDRWHLNGMRAGTYEQEAWVRDHHAEYPGYPVSHY